MSEDLVALQERLTALEARLAVHDAREEIRDVLYRYARGADRCDLELFKSCYHPDATDCHWFYNGNAHDFADYVIPLLSECDNSQHSITNPLIDLDLDNGRAFVECQWYVLHHIPFGEGRYIDQQVEGRYLDVFERRDGEWLILHRQTVVEAFREFVVDDFVAGRGYSDDHPAVGRRAPADAVYRGAAIADDPITPVDGLDLWGQARARNS